MRQRAWLSDEDVETQKQLSNVLPGIQDILRFMVKDTERADLVRRFGLRDEFADNYQGKLKEYAQAQGLSDELAEKYWIAHWQNVPATALYEFLHRLRPEKYGAARDAHGYPLAVTADDVFKALGQNDVPPAWRSRFMEISYRVMRQVDARRAFLQNLSTEQQLRGQFLDQGQAPEAADTLVKVARRGKRDALRASAIVRAYIRAQVSDQTATAQLLNDGYELQQINDALTWARAEAQRQSQARCLAGLRRRYMSGEIPDEALQQTLQRLDLGVQQIQRLIGQWACERSYKPKELSAAQLCKARDRGLISDADMNLRLQRLGYSQAAAAAIVALCQLAYQDKLSKQKKPRGGAAAAAVAPGGNGHG